MRFSFTKFLVLFIILGSVFDLGVLALQNLNLSSFAILANSSADNLSSPSPTPTQTPFPKSSGLKKAVSDALQGSHGDYAVVVENLKTGESYGQNEHQSFESGSLYKLWVMAAVFEQVKEGKLSEDQTISEDVATLNQKFSIDPDDAEQTSGTITYTVADALKKMITISDNYAALLLTEKIGLSKVAAFLSENHFDESKVGTNGDTPTTTASDIALFYSKLYKGELADPVYTKKMTDLLKAQALNEKIPQYLPEQVTVAHKTGELDSYSHDAGIIYSPAGDYILVVLSNTNSQPQANERIAEISKNVYNYFND